MRLCRTESVMKAEQNRALVEYGYSFKVVKQQVFKG